MANGHTKRGFTCEGICIFVTSAQVYPARIFFNELRDLVDIRERKFVLLEKPLGSGEWIFCKYISPIRFSRRRQKQNTPLALYGSLRGGTPSWMSTSKT
jgi:hypothetical protein